jgi:hypothetical protein
VLGVHVRIGERLSKRTAPAVDVHGQAEVGLLEQLALPPGLRPRVLELPSLGIPGL